MLKLELLRPGTAFYVPEVVDGGLTYAEMLFTYVGYTTWIGYGPPDPTIPKQCKSYVMLAATDRWARMNDPNCRPDFTPLNRVCHSPQGSGIVKHVEQHGIVLAGWL